MEPNQEYVKTVNALIPFAEKKAVERVARLPIDKRTKIVIGIDGHRYKHDMYSQYFHEEMKILCQKHKLRKY